MQIWTLTRSLGLQIDQSFVFEVPVVSTLILICSACWPVSLPWWVLSFENMVRLYRKRSQVTGLWEFGKVKAIGFPENKSREQGRAKQYMSAAKHDITEQGYSPQSCVSPSSS